MSREGERDHTSTHELENSIENKQLSPPQIRQLIEP